MPRVLCALSLATTLATLNGNAQAPAKTMLWSVRGVDGPPIYLAGSVHLLSKEYYPLSEVWNRAFESSSVLIEEIDLAETEDAAAAMGLLSRGTLRDGRTLADLIPGELYAKVMARAETLGLPEAALRHMKPWVAALSLTAPELRRSGFDPMLGIDRHFFDRAREAGKERRALETASYQLDRLDQLSPALQTSMLKSALEELDTGPADLHTIADAWKTGNLVTLERLLLAALLESPELYQRLLGRPQSIVGRAGGSVPRQEDFVLRRRRRCSPGGAAQPRRDASRQGISSDTAVAQAFRPARPRQPLLSRCSLELACVGRRFRAAGGAP